tara:strand:+ start:724 stop:867 length:144 start_codon:yes stop_codon:yes gene_type:complete
MFTFLNVTDSYWNFVKDSDGCLVHVSVDKYPTQQSAVEEVQRQIIEQ